jgi:hypothetical protein
MPKRATFAAINTETEIIENVDSGNVRGSDRAESKIPRSTAHSKITTCHAFHVLIAIPSSIYTSSRLFTILLVWRLSWWRRGWRLEQELL